MPRVTVVGLQLGVAAGRAAAAWTDWQADSEHDSSSLFLGGRIEDGVGVFYLSFIHELRDNYTYFGDNYNM